MIAELFWIQEGTNEGFAQMQIFKFEIERETPKTFIAKTRNRDSFGLKVINKVHFNKYFFASTLDALDAKENSIKRRANGNESIYLLGQLRNIKELRKFNTPAVQQRNK